MLKDFAVVLDVFLVHRTKLRGDPQHRIEKRVTVEFARSHLTAPCALPTPGGRSPPLPTRPSAVTAEGGGGGRDVEPSRSNHDATCSVRSSTMRPTIADPRFTRTPATGR